MEGKKEPAMSIQVLQPDFSKAVFCVCLGRLWDVRVCIRQCLCIYSCFRKDTERPNDTLRQAGVISSAVQQEVSTCSDCSGGFASGGGA